MFGLTLFAAVAVFTGGMVVGWFLLPAPKFVQEFWVNKGWADRVT